MKTYLSRILRDKVKLTILLILFFIPAMEVVQIMWQIAQGASVPNPHYATFLSLYTIRHYLHKIMFWFLPVFLLLVVNEDGIEDQELGYRNVLITRMGKKQYLKVKLLGSFILSFLVVFLGLLLNMALVYLCFREGTFTKDDFANDLTYMQRDISRITVSNPVAANLIYIFMTSFLSGMLGALGSAIAITVQERKFVYGLAFLLWFIPVMEKHSLMYVIQPFTYLNYEQVLPMLIGLVVSYMIIIAAAVLMEVRDETI